MIAVTRDDLVARREALRQGVMTLQADLAATNGALQEVEFWLAKLGAPSTGVDTVMSGVNNFGQFVPPA